MNLISWVTAAGRFVATGNGTYSCNRTLRSEQNGTVWMTDGTQVFTTLRQTVVYPCADILAPVKAGLLLPRNRRFI